MIGIEFKSASLSLITTLPRWVKFNDGPGINEEWLSSKVYVNKIIMLQVSCGGGTLVMGPRCVKAGSPSPGEHDPQPRVKSGHQISVPLLLEG